MTTSKALIKTKNLNIGYSDCAVYESVQLEASAGEVICLIGENGIGKSTLLRTLSGILAPIDGDVLFNDQAISHMKSRAKAKKIASVFSDQAYHAFLSVHDFVSMGRYPYNNLLGLNRRNDIKSIKASLQATGIEALANRHINTLSDGEKKKAMIARALTQETPVLILDEPLVYLDIPSKFDTIGLLHQLAVKNNKTIIFSTHDIGLALKTADKIWLMTKTNWHEGAPEDLVLAGAIQEFLSHQNIEFTPETMSISMKKRNTKQITLKGDGLIFQLTKSALERSGFEIKDNSPHKINVSSEKSTPTWYYHHSNSPDKHFFSIYELIKFCRNQSFL